MDVDILVMPTVAQPPRNMGNEGEKLRPLEDNDYLPGIIYNTSPFDSKFSGLYFLLT